MPDYGHDLLFGSFVTPLADDAAHVLELATLADDLRLDLFTVQDHPYQRRFLDAWTLLSVVAARTTHVHVLPNVANLPLRQPAVLARSVASLDILSGGRAELGLGAGAFWDAIVANGGPRRSPGEAVAALDEAIAIVRGLWDPSGASVQVHGSTYAVVGAQPGPPPVHDPAIWVGATGPRMLRLIGRAADGWLPSLGYVGPDRLPGMNAAIDEAALAAGRVPADVRRVYNVSGRFTRAAGVPSGSGPGSGSASGGGVGTLPAAGDGLLDGPPAVWAEQLATIALEHGMSGFILASDDADDLRRFALEVAPAVRELVDEERAIEDPHAS
jgi:alkanesulfonate monooxygenase SsuD/methylene tetrahydromethanopterin reductase-like flavin-dependent oxidoreductase (luciferase family)